MENEKNKVGNLLKDYKKGENLYSILHGTIIFDHIGEHCIVCKYKDSSINNPIVFDLDGKELISFDKFTNECVLFPDKDKKSWNLFTQNILKDRPLGYTTLEESKLLLSLNVDPGPSDYFYNLAEGKEYPFVGKRFEQDEIIKDIIPCWSLGVLIDLLPKTIWFHEISKSLQIEYEDGKYEVYYISGFCATHSCFSKFLIEAVIDMIVWLIKNNIQTKRI